jgi:hypothetical protein
MIRLRLAPVGSRRMGRLTSRTVLQRDTAFSARPLAGGSPVLFIGTHVLRRHQSSVMTKHLKLATEMMRADAGLHSRLASRVTRLLGISHLAQPLHQGQDAAGCSRPGGGFRLQQAVACRSAEATMTVARSDGTPLIEEMFMNNIALVVLAVIMALPALAQSHDPSIGTGNIDRSVITAPVGHRQPRASDVPKIGDSPSASARDRKLDRALQICRGC